MFGSHNMPGSRKATMERHFDRDGALCNSFLGPKGFVVIIAFLVAIVVIIAFLGPKGFV